MPKTGRRTENAAPHFIQPLNGTVPVSASPTSVTPVQHSRSVKIVRTFEHASNSNPAPLWRGIFPSALLQVCHDDSSEL